MSADYFSIAYVASSKSKLKRYSSTVASLIENQRGVINYYVIASRLHYLISTR